MLPRHAPAARWAFQDLCHGQALEAAGRSEEAAAAYEKAAIQGERLSHPYLTLNSRRRLGRLLGSRGDEVTATALLEGAREAGQSAGLDLIRAGVEVELARIALEGGDHGRAAELIESSAPVLKAPPHGFDGCRWLALHARIRTAAGDDEAAAAAAGRAVELLALLEVTGGWVERDVRAAQT